MTSQLLSTLCETLTYPHLILAYFTAYIVFPPLCLVLKPLPALRMAIDSRSVLVRCFLYYAVGDVFLSLSEGIDNYLIMGMSMFMVGHVEYLSRSKHMCLGVYALLVVVLMFVPKLPETVSLCLFYFPFLIACVIYAYNNDTDRVPGWLLFLISDLLLACEIVFDTGFSKVPLVIYWTALYLL